MTLRARWRPGDRYLVRHLDKALVVVEKRAGLLSHKNQDGDENLLDGIREFIHTRGGGPVLPVHRLDRVVSGLLVFARSKEAEGRLIDQFADHKPERRYLAMVNGVIERDKGTFESWLYLDDVSTRVYSIDREEPGARFAITHWRVIERYEKATLVEAHLETGIRNQIRVQFADAGHPLLGERKYAERSTAQGQGRLFLHAAGLAFEHPYSKQMLKFDASMPPDLRAWQRQIAHGAMNMNPPRPPAKPGKGKAPAKKKRKR